MELSQRKKISSIVTNECQFIGIDIGYIGYIGDALNHSDKCTLSRMPTVEKLLVNQVLSILALNLAQICLVYINTLMIQQILNEKHWQDRLTKEDYRTLSPLVCGYINP